MAFLEILRRKATELLAQTDGGNTGSYAWLPPGWTWNPATRSLRVSGTQVEVAAQAALTKADKIESATVRVLQQHVELDLELTGGYQVRMQVVPRLVQVDGAQVSFACDLLDDIDVSHRSAVVRFIINLFDGIFGFKAGALKRVPGLTLDGRRLEWTRDLPQSTSLSAVLTGLKIAGVVRAGAHMTVTIDGGDLVLTPGQE